MKTIALIIALCFMANSIAGLPPTTLRGQNQSSVTTFNFQVPNNQATKTTTGTLNETGNTNILSNPSGEGSSTSPWNLTNGSLAIETSVVVHGAQSLKATLSAQQLELFNSSTLYAAQFADGVNGALSIRVKTSLSTIFVCPSQNSTTNYNLCLPVDSSNKWLSYKVPFVFGSGNQGLVLVSGSISSGVFTPGNVTGDVYVDDAFVGTDEGSVASIITPWTAYTPTFTGFGTVTCSLCMEWRQVGSGIELRGKFVSGVSTATEGRMTLPNSYTSSSPSIQIVGTAAYSIATATPVFMLSENAVGYLTFGTQTAGAAGLTKQNGSSVASSTNTLSIIASIPVRELSGSTQVFASQCGAGCADLLRADVSAAGVVSNEDIEFINGNAVVSDTSLFTFTFTGGIFTVAPKCWAEANLTALAYGTQRDSVSSSAVAIRTYNDAGAKAAQPFTIWCTKSGADYQSSRTIVGSFKEVPKVVGVNSPKICLASFGGAAATLASPTACSSGTCVETFDSCGTFSPPAFSSSGEYINYTFASGTFANSSYVQCTCQAYDTASSAPSDCHTLFYTGDNTWLTNASGGLTNNTFTTSNTGAASNKYVQVQCIGSAP